MRKRETLDAQLSIAEAAIVRATFGSAVIGAGWTDTKFKLDRARLYCRQLRAVLVELNDSESTDKLDKARAYCREVRAVLLELRPTATIPFNCLEPICSVLRSPRTTCWLDHLEGLIAARRVLETSSNSLTKAQAPTPDQTTHRSDLDFSAQKARRKDALAMLPLLRQTIGLLALVLAYLLYFHIDVQLQIVKLASIFL